MSQIKPTQIIPGRENRINPVSPLPVDLDPAQRSLIKPVVVDSVAQMITDQTVNEQFALQSTESVLTDSDRTPATPAIISVKEQVVRFMPDGTAKVDLVLEVQDIDNAVEYDIRIAKDAGNV